MRKRTHVQIIVVKGGLNAMTVISSGCENDWWHQIINLQCVRNSTVLSGSVQLWLGLMCPGSSWNSWSKPLSWVSTTISMWLKPCICIYEQIWKSCLKIATWYKFIRFQWEPLSLEFWRILISVFKWLSIWIGHIELSSYGLHIFQLSNILN